MTGPIAPARGLTLPQTRADWQQLIHVGTLGAVPLLVLAHLGTNDQWTQWAPVFLAAVDSLLSWSNSPDPTRRAIYAVGGLIQTVLVAVGLMNQVTAAAWFGAAMTYLNSVLATFYTPTSTLKVVATPHKEAA